MIDWTKPIRTKDGMKARLLGELSNAVYTRAVAVDLEEDGEYVTQYTEEGKSNSGNNSIIDLENIPEVLKVKLHISKYGEGKIEICASIPAKLNVWPFDSNCEKSSTGKIIEIEL